MRESLRRRFGCNESSGTCTVYEAQSLQLWLYEKDLKMAGDEEMAVILRLARHDRKYSPKRIPLERVFTGIDTDHSMTTVKYSIWKLRLVVAEDEFPSTRRCPSPSAHHDTNRLCIYILST